MEQCEAPACAQWLRQHIRSLAPALERNPKFAGMFTIEWEQYLLDFGQAFPWREPDWGRYPEGEAGQCYREATHLAIDNDDLRYVEGMAINYGDIPIAHGWCIDSEGFVVDVTWPTTLDSDRRELRQYFGVEIPTDRLRELIVEHQWYGVLPFMIKAELALDHLPLRGGF